MVYPMLDGLLQVDHLGSLGVGWKEQRTVVSSIFTSGKMKKMHHLFHDQMDNLVEQLREKSNVNGGKMDIYGPYFDFQPTHDIRYSCNDNANRTNPHYHLYNPEKSAHPSISATSLLQWCSSQLCPLPVRNHVLASSGALHHGVVVLHRLPCTDDHYILHNIVQTVRHWHCEMQF
ncbi:hypothetical protein PMAYCL1PPCAC_16525 [Pristionchus mayeri]|uniref:Uncharacterized protein n=1 Tax=Pristionchus mayeri TaxID=1317129 RepID=A0AAN5CL51_9BILA|nr:hypothetical protein PMAYCL1PPCAC_16525 [Pristionchus mayeri]